MRGTRSARRSTLSRALFALILLFLGIVSIGFYAFPKVRNEPRVLWFDFNRDAVSILNSAGFRVVGVDSMSPEEIPVPIRARIRMLFHFSDRVQLPEDELEPTTLRIVAQRDGGEVRCLARYHAGYIAKIVLRYPHGLEKLALDLKKVLNKAYPLERVEIAEDPTVPLTIAPP
jgi:hypothetical protein